ncbi:T9SS type A sorting domain-containing protein [Hyphobacterium sp. CCMP332]|nr:T9SS type A sorting domain-containing protein [Hyphobacterium sp. CCMP332]
MKTAIKYFLFSITFLFLSPKSQAQLYNNFDNSQDFQVVIDYSDSINIWQIADAAKFHDFVSCGNYSLVTDSVNNYPKGDTSYATFRIDSISNFYNWPFVIMNWVNLFQFDSLNAGGWIEISYDSGSSWYNVISDTNSHAEYMGSHILDTLKNGEKTFFWGKSDGFISPTTQNNQWSYEGICWSMSDTASLFAKSEVIDFRFVFWSDTGAAEQLGWAIDDISFFPSFIDFLGNKSKPDNELLDVYPNPVKNTLFFYDKSAESGSKNIRIVSADGKEILRKNTSQSNIELDLSQMESGIYYYIFERGSEKITGKFIKQ